jgi:hypothetical protein
MIEPPVILWNNGDIVVFETVADAQRYVEPVDVQNGEYKAFDAKGQSLELIGETRRTGRIFRHESAAVVIRESQPPGPHRDELRRILVDVLIRRGTPKAELLERSLATLIDEVARPSR